MSAVSSNSAPAPLFSLGRREVTPAAQAALDRSGTSSTSLFQRHEQGDWGSVAEWVVSGNAKAIQHGAASHTIQSAYTLENGADVLVMTSNNRAYTRLLLASEYQRLDITAKEGYALWSETYDTVPNALIKVEQPVVEAILAGLPPLTNAVDVGTGTGRLALLLARQGVTVTALDLSPDMLALARRTAEAEGLHNVTFAEADLNSGAIPAASCQFDLVTCALTLCHVQNISAAIAECARMVRPGGHLLLTDFHPHAITWGWHPAVVVPGVHYRLPAPGHSRDEFLQALSGAGCTTQEAHDLAISGEPYGDISNEGPVKRGEPPLCLILLAVKK